MRELNIASDWTPQLPNPTLARPKLIVEIGCGAGFHPVKLAKENPSADVVGIEQTKTRFAAFEQRRAGHPELVNLHAVRSDAVLWVSRMLPTESVDAFYILYPNPSPKPSQRNRRWHSMPFTKVMVDRLKVGGKLVLASNMKWYVEEAIEAFATFGLSLQSCVMLNGLDRSPQSHFEKKYLERGEACWECALEKSSRNR